MKLLILYHPDSEFSTAAEDFAKECRTRTSQPVDMLSVDSPAGSSLAELYDIVDYPAILVAREDGQLTKFWQGGSFPLVDEVIGYLNN